MKKSGILFLITIFFYVLSGCTDDRIPPVNNDNESVNEWIYEKMADNYLWYDELPDYSTNTSDPEEYFYTLLTKKDGKTSGSQHYYYSYIKKKNQETKAYQGDDLSFGFEFTLYVDGNDPNLYSILIVYVLPNSPAEQAGLKRGDWIVAIDNSPITYSNASELSRMTSASLGISDEFGITPLRTISLTAATVIDNPVYLAKTLDYQGKRIGYLVYNHFNSGRDESSTYSEEFNNSLRDAFSEFASQNLDEFILDLRYNPGGKVTCAQLLATMLAPASALGDVFCTLTYNDKKESSNHSLKFDKSFMEKGSGGKNLNLSRVYVITSRNTASASEAVINGLTPFMDVRIIGERTEGKNVGSLTYTEESIDWEIHPIVCYVANKEGYSSSDGFGPASSSDKYYFVENSRQIYELGDVQDWLLAKTLQVMTENNFRSGNSEPESGDLKMLYSSIENRKTNSIRLD